MVNKCSYNPVQNILIKIKKWSRVRQVRLWHFFFRIFRVPVPKTHFYREDLTLGSIPHTILKIFLCFLFSIILRLTSFRNIWVNSYIASYTRYQVNFYFWWMEPILKLCKVLKYYEQDCQKNLLLLLTSLKVIKISYHSAILNQVRTIYLKKLPPTKVPSVLKSIFDLYLTCQMMLIVWQLRETLN